MFVFLLRTLCGEGDEGTRAGEVSCVCCTAALVVSKGPRDYLRKSRSQTHKVFLMENFVQTVALLNPRWNAGIHFCSGSLTP